MSQKLRVFISSTTEDLKNERQEIVKQVESLGLEAVNAEAFLPTGESSWRLLESEIRSSHIFLLVLGERYGWVPSIGSGAGTGKSATHLEYDQARACNIPILPFVKTLGYGSDSTSDAAVARDGFRRIVGDWGSGLFHASFDLAHDLGAKVREGLIGVFTNSYLKERIRESEASSLTAKTPTLFLKNNPTSNIARGNQVLLAGAGMSISAGYPSASVLAELLGRQLGLIADGITILSRHSFVDLALLAEETLGRDKVIEIILELMNTAIPVEPTTAHMLAVLNYRSIVTTNYDTLFEQACEIQGIQFTIKTAGEPRKSKPSAVDIYKIDGTIEDVRSLVFTPNDHAIVRSCLSFWREMEELMQSCPVTIVGHSIRDPSSRHLLHGRNVNLKGLYVSPHLDELDEILMNRFKLVGVKSSADDFLINLVTASDDQLRKNLL